MSSPVVFSAKDRHRGRAAGPERATRTGASRPRRANQTSREVKGGKHARLLQVLGPGRRPGERGRGRREGARRRATAVNPPGLVYASKVDRVQVEKWAPRGPANSPRGAVICWETSMSCDRDTDLSLEEEERLIRALRALDPTRDRELPPMLSPAELREWADRRESES